MLRQESQHLSKALGIVIEKMLSSSANAGYLFFQHGARSSKVSIQGAACEMMSSGSVVTHLFCAAVRKTRVSRKTPLQALALCLDFPLQVDSQRRKRKGANCSSR